MTTDNRNEDPDRAMEAFTKPIEIFELIELKILFARLREAVDDIAFSGRSDPHDDKALLREAARELQSSSNRRAYFGGLADRHASESAGLFRLLYDIAALDPDDTQMSKTEFRGRVRELAGKRMDVISADHVALSKLVDDIEQHTAHDLGMKPEGEGPLVVAARLLNLARARGAFNGPDLRLSLEAAAEQRDFGQWLVTTFQPGAVEPAAVICPGGVYESGAAFCRRALQMALERGAFHWANPTPLWHERQDGKRPEEAWSLEENLDAAALAIQSLAIGEDGQLNPEARAGTVRSLQPLLGYARTAARELCRRADQVDAYRKTAHEIGQHLISAHQPGQVDAASVAILDGYHVGEKLVAGGGAGEPGETTLDAALRLLKLAMSRGAFAPGEHIQTEQGPMLLMQGEATSLCTGDVAPGAEAVDTRFVELFYLSGPRVGLRFEGVPDIYVPDADAHAIARTLLSGGEHSAPSWKVISRAAEYFGQRVHVDSARGKLVLTDSSTYYAVQPVTQERIDLLGWRAAVDEQREAVNPSPTGQARRALERLGPNLAGTGSSIKLAAALSIGPACGLSIDEFRPLLAAWNEAGYPVWDAAELERRLVDRYAQADDEPPAA